MRTEWLLIENGDVIDCISDTNRPDTSVLIRNDRIVAVGDLSELEQQIPRGAALTRLDARNRTVMPGLIDAHCHMTYGESRSEEEIDLYTSPETRTLKAAFHAQKVLRSGVTSISQPGGSYFIGVGLRDAIRDGIVLGPRMTSAGRYVTTSNGLADFYPDSVGAVEGSIGILTNTVQEMITEVRRQVKAGVDLIKLADSPYGNYQAFTEDELKQVTELTHQLGKKVTIHARGPAEVGAAARAGVDWIMHGNRMTDEVIDEVATRGTPLVPTLLLLANIAEWGKLVGTPAPLRDGMARALDKSADSLHRAHAAGVPMVTGTDSGFSVTPYGEWHARELELLMDYAGMTAIEAIRAATCNAAPMLGLTGELGMIAPGMIADVIVVAGDPLRNIRVLQDKQNIETVIKDGAIVRFDEELLARSWPHERGQTYSTSDLTFDLVQRAREDDLESALVPNGFAGDDGHDLAATVRRYEKDAVAAD